MRPYSVRTLALAVVMFALAGGVGAQVVNVTQDIAASTTWTANNTYNLVNQIYVLPGATLTIEAGTVIASTPTPNGAGALAVSQGAQIHVQGTQSNPVIMTSSADVATWTNGDPKTGTWREAANEWGNLTIMGDGYISEDATVGNTPTPNAANVAQMEGLTAAFPGDPKVVYGGGDDNDDSGSISHLSIRYGGRVVGLNNELNGLSLGGIGRETDIHHVEIMNNVDDGIEIWGGTVNLKYFSIWNVGDDSFDVDQGWRGKAQFGLIVQGHSLDASQGSGVGDNGFETDGAEDSDWQPVTTASIYNCTVIGQPVDGDGLTTWRDNARVQYRNCIFMDGGERVVKFDNWDGDGASGYGHNGTLSWPATWQTPYTATSTVNPAANPAAMYTAQTSGMLAEIKDSVFFNNMGSSAYTEAENIGVEGHTSSGYPSMPSGLNIFTAAGYNNVKEPANSPITTITRGAPVVRGGKVMLPVTFLDPRPQNDALTSAATAPNDGFFSPVSFRGAFAPGFNWLCCWTASSAYGLTPNDYTTATPGVGQPGLPGAAMMDINGARNVNCSEVGSTSDANGPHFSWVASGENLNFTFDGEPNQAIILLAGSQLNTGLYNLQNLVGNAGAGMIDIGTAGTPLPNVEFVADGNLPGFFNQLFNTGPTGTVTMSLPQNLPPGTEYNLQCVFFNSTTIIRASNAVQIQIF